MRKSRSRLFKVCMVLFVVFFVLAVLVGFSACSGCGGDEAEVESVSLSSTSLTIEEGKTATVTASVKMSDDSSYEGSYSWTTSASSVATVSGSGATGTVTAVKAGSATITVTVDSGDKATCSVTVTEATSEPEPETPTVSEAAFEAEDAALFNAQGTVTSLMTADATTGTVSNVTAGDEIVFQVLASAAISAVTMGVEGSGADALTVFLNGDDVTSDTIALKSGVNYIELAAPSDMTGSVSVDKINLSWSGSATVTAEGAAGTVFEVGADGKATLEAENASLMNAVGSSGSTNVIKTETSSTGVDQVANFNVKGDEIVFQVNATAAVDVTLAAYVFPSTDDFDAADHAGFIKVNGNDAALTNYEALPKSAYGALTATVSLSAGINYIEIVCDTTGGTLFGMNLGFMNVDRIELTSYAPVAIDKTKDADSLKYNGTNSLEGYDYAIKTRTDSNNGNVVYVLDGTASEMDTALASWFGDGAKAGDEYVTVKIYVGADNTLTYMSNSSIDKTVAGSTLESDGYCYYFAYRLSGLHADGTPVTPSAAKSYTISDSQSNTIETVTIDYTKIEVVGTSIDGLAVPDADVDSGSLKDGNTTFDVGDYVIEKITDEDGSIVYVLEGTAANMDSAVAIWFGDGAQAGDAYVTVKIYVGAENTLTYTSAGDKEKTIDGSSLESDGYYYYLAYRLSGVFEDGSAVAPSSAKTYTIKDSSGNVVETITIDYTKLEFVGKLAVPDKDADKDALKIGDEAYIAEGMDYAITVTSDESGNAIYVLEGTASEMDATLAAWYGDGAVAGDEYVVVKIYVGTGNTISYTSGTEQKSYGSGYIESDGYYYFVYRLSGTHADGSAVVPSSAKEYTIKDSDEQQIVTVTIDYTKMVVIGNSIDGLVVPDAETDSSSLLIDETNSVAVGDYTIEKITDEDGNIVYVLEGTAANMSEAVAEWFGDGAYAGDAYVTVKIYVGANNTLTYTSNTNIEKTILGSSLASDGYYYYFAYRLSGVHANGSAVAPSSEKVYTITDADGNTVETITIDYTKLEFVAVGDIVVPDPDNDTDDATAMAVPNGDNELFEGYDYEITVSADKDGNVVYVLDGVASNMTSAVATWFGNGAAAGDAYVMVKIYVGAGNTISYTSGTENKSYTNSAAADASMFDGEWYFFVYRLSGTDASGNAVTPSSSKTYTITSGEKTTSITVTIDFSQITFTAIDNLSVPDATADATDLVYSGNNSVAGYDYTIGKTTDEKGNVTYTLYGTASVMDETLASWFGSGAQAGDAYVTVKIYVGVSNTLTYTSVGDENKTISATDLTSDGWYIFVYRLSGTDVNPSSAKTYTITDSTNSTTTTVTIDYTKITIPEATTEG